MASPDTFKNRLRHNAAAGILRTDKNQLLIGLHTVSPPSAIHSSAYRSVESSFILLDLNQMVACSLHKPVHDSLSQLSAVKALRIDL